MSASLVRQSKDIFQFPQPIRDAIHHSRRGPQRLIDMGEIIIHKVDRPRIRRSQVGQCRRDGRRFANRIWLEGAPEAEVDWGVQLAPK